MLQMKANLPPFTRQATCPKCGWPDIQTTFAPHVGVHFDSQCGEWVDGRTDMMRRECRECGYRWYELPLDAEESPDAP